MREKETETENEEDRETAHVCFKHLNMLRWQHFKIIKTCLLSCLSSVALYTFKQTLMNACTYICIYIFIYIHAHTCKCTCIETYVSIHNLNISRHVHIHIFIIHTHMHIRMQNTNTCTNYPSLAWASCSWQKSPYFEFSACKYGKTLDTSKFSFPPSLSPTPPRPPPQPTPASGLTLSILLLIVVLQKVCWKRARHT